MLIFLVACTFGKAGLLIPENQLPNWAAPPKNFSLSDNEVSLGSKLDTMVGPADYAWSIAYFFGDSKKWEKLSINPLLTTDPIVKQWIKGTAKFSLDITQEKFTPGKTYYIIGYWCNKRQTWECNGGKWMLLAFKVKETAIKEFDTLTNELEQIEKELNTSYETGEVIDIESLDLEP